MAKNEKVTKALEQFKLSALTYKGQRDRERAYLEFQIPEMQWQKEIRDYRQSQFGNDGVPMPPDPTLSISMIDEPLALVENQFRAANLEPKIHPLTEEATDGTALVLTELNRHIDMDPDSRADNARGWAFARALRAGIGWYYLAKEFDPEGGHPFDQRILVKRLLYQDGIFPDPTAQQADWSDGMFLHDIVDLPSDLYAAKYPDSKLAKYGESDFKALGPDEAAWVPYLNSTSTDKDGKESPVNKGRAIRVSNYWRVEIHTRRQVLLHDQSVAFDDEIPEGSHAMTDDEADALHYKGQRDRSVETRCVYKSVINGIEELEPEIEWDGQYIPYVPVIGIELQPFDGERRWVGMIAGAMDAQRLVNYSASQAVKMAALEPQAPWQGEEGVFEGHEQEYAQTNTRKFYKLEYKPTNSAGMRSTPPTRVQVDVSRLGPSMELLTMGKDFVQRAMFTFGPGLGEQTPAHRSGTAIQALQGQTMQGNSHYLDNVANISVPLEMKIKLDLIPHVYDRAGRVVHVITGEGKSRQVMLNQPFVMQANRPVAAIQQPANAALPDGVTHYDLNKGRYGVSVTIGKSNDSRLQEGSDAIGRLLEKDPALLPVLGPSWAGFQDFPGAHSVKEALTKWQQHVAPFMTDQNQQTAAAQLAQVQGQLQQVTQAAQKMQQELATDATKYAMQAEIEKHKSDIQLELKRMDDATKIEIARITAAKEGIIADREAAEERLATGLKILADATEAHAQRQHELTTAGLEHGAIAAKSHQEHQQNLAESTQENQHALEQAEADRQVAEANATKQPASDSGGAGSA